MARRFTRGIQRGARRETSWFNVPFTSVTNNATATIVSSLSASGLARRPFTAIRTHVELLISSDQSIASESQLGAFGIAVVSDQAQAIGVTAVPTPVTDLESDLWFVHQVMLNRYQFHDATGVQATYGSKYTVDSKAMRKVNDDQDIVMVVENSTVGSGQIVLMAGRMLIKEH